MTEKAKRLKVLQSEWSDCTKCKLATLRSRIVFGSGNPEARLVFVGEAPDEEQDSGRAHRADVLFNKILAAVDIKREDIWVTNSCLCWPKAKLENRSGRPPNKKEIEACRPRFQEEMRIVKPKIVVLGGNTPLLMATGIRGITKHRGWVVKPAEGRSSIYATLHPASMLYGGVDQVAQKKRWAWEDWQRIAKVYHECEEQTA